MPGGKFEISLQKRLNGVHKGSRCGSVNVSANHQATHGLGWKQELQEGLVQGEHLLVPAWHSGQLALDEDDFFFEFNPTFRFSKVFGSADLDVFNPLVIC